MTTLKLFAATLPAFLLLDLLWLGVLMKGFYDREIGDLARRSGGALAPRWGAAAIVYLLIPLGVVLLVRPAAGEAAAVARAAAWGAAYGAILYGVYDFTNLALLAGWSVKMTLVDVAWGTVLCAASAAWMQFVALQWMAKP